MKKIIAGLLLAFYSISFAQTTSGTLDPTQVYNTGNIVLPTTTGANYTPWVNGVYQNNLTCWAWGNPGYCGPNAIVRPGNVINFSYGFTDLYQSQAIANVLPNSGSGLRVNGYNFSFMAKNGNGWDDGRVDYLYAYTHFTDQNNQVVFYKNYNLTSKFDWTYFNFNETFNTPFASKDLKNVTYGFVGYDANGWAGPYGPEIYNVNFSLKYSVDPCFVNVLSSPSCPGYLEELAKLSPATSTTMATIETTPTTTTSITTDPVNPVIVQYSGAPVVASSTSSSQPVSNSGTSPSSTSTTSTSVASTPSSPSREVNNNGLSIGLSVVARNQQREQTLALQVAQNAVAAADQASQQAQQEAVSVAQTSVASSVVNTSNPVARQFQLSNRADQSSVIVSSQSQTGVAVLMSGPLASVSRNESRSSSSLTTQEVSAIVTSTLPQMFTSQIAVETTSNQISSSLSLLPPAGQTNNQAQSVAALTQDNKDSGIKFSLQNQAQFTFNTSEIALADNQKFLIDRTNPINAIINERPLDQSNQQTQTRASVNTNVVNNEIAGGVNLTRMAVAPAGYNQYLNLVIADAAFYAPKEVYRNQRNVDNVRVLRSLSSDRLHQEMVNQQYRK